MYIRMYVLKLRSFIGIATEFTYEFTKQNDTGLPERINNSAKVLETILQSLRFRYFAVASSRLKSS